MTATEQASKPRTPLTWPDAITILGMFALTLGAVCFIVWVVAG